MPRRSGQHQVLVKGAEDAMTAFKLEVTEDLRLDYKLTQEGEFDNMSAREVGVIGGEMVRRIQIMGQWIIKQRYERDESRLVPLELLPPPHLVRDVSNQGNPMPPLQ